MKTLRRLGLWITLFTMLFIGSCSKDEEAPFVGDPPEFSIESITSQLPGTIYVVVGITKLGTAQQGGIEPTEVGVFLNESPNSSSQANKQLLLKRTSTSYNLTISKLKTGQAYYLAPYLISEGKLIFALGRCYHRPQLKLILKHG